MMTLQLPPGSNWSPGVKTVHFPAKPSLVTVELPPCFLLGLVSLTPDLLTCVGGPRGEFPAFGRGLDSNRPLHKSRRFGCVYAAESLSPKKWSVLDARWPPPSIGRRCGVLC